MQYIQILPGIHCQQQTHGHLERVAHTQRLTAVLSSWKSRLVPVDRDGNCFFTSVALELVQNATNIIRELSMGLDSPVTDLMLKLREIIVGEWTDWFEYNSFTSSSKDQYEAEANQFLNNTYYDSELGNTMPLAMANALGVCFVVFTSKEPSPVYYVTPRNNSNTVLYLAYTERVAGHYGSLPSVIIIECFSTSRY